MKMCLDRVTDGTARWMCRWLHTRCTRPQLTRRRSDKGTDMNTQEISEQRQLLFASLFNPGRGIAVPCDAHGEVHMDELTERMKNAYLAARALVGREYAHPVIQPVR